MVGVVLRIEQALIKLPQDPRLAQLFLQVKRARDDRSVPCSILHIRSHLGTQGLGEGNACADALVSPLLHALQDSFQAARSSHNMFHQSAKALRRQFGLTGTEAKGIVRACSQGSQHGSSLGLGVNPKGLQACEIWQMDVTHVPEFGRLKYVHVSIDTFSRMLWATAQAGEKAAHVVRHLTACFAVMGVPQEIKTDNGPAYTGGWVHRFLQMWGVKHVTGIPPSPTGQAMIERAHRTVKEYLTKQKQEEEIDPVVRLSRVLFTLHFLSLVGDAELAPVIIHHSQIRMQSTPSEKVQYRNPTTAMWEGPAPLLFNSRGYSCVSPGSGPLWVPSKWTKPAPNINNPSQPDDYNSDSGEQ